MIHARTRFRIALYSQVLLAAVCQFSFEKYLHTSCHPGPLEEEFLRHTGELALALYFWLFLETVFADISPPWRRVVCFLASAIATWGAFTLAKGVYWGAVVRY